MIESIANSAFDFSRLEKLDKLDPLGKALLDLADRLDIRQREQERFDEITGLINAGMTLAEVMERVYENFRSLIPYQRIGVALIEENGQVVRSVWLHSDFPDIQIAPGYASQLKGSSLETIIHTGQPRIINDLNAYLEKKPESESSQLIVREGVRSSLTCPLIANGVPIGFIFFSSAQPNTYDEGHIQTFQRIANQLSVIVEKGRLVSLLAAQKAAFEEQNVVLRRLDELKNTLLGIAAHDLRNPIANIQVTANILLSEDPPLEEEEQDNFLRDITRQTSHMLKLINDLLDTTQIKAGKLSLNMEQIDITTCLEEIVKNHNSLAAPKNTVVNLGKTQVDIVVANPIRLRQVMDNLISNAVKFSPPNSAVLVNAQREDGYWRIPVKDEGPGLTEADRSKLFTEFPGFQRARLRVRKAWDWVYPSPKGLSKPTAVGSAWI